MQQIRFKRLLLRVRQTLGISAALFSCVAFADELPEPLTLEYALQQADQHPELATSAAELNMAQARFLAAAADNDFDVSLNGRLQWIGPSKLAPDQDHDDHKISLNAEKTLYDFGRSAAGTAFAETAVGAKALELDYQQGLKRIDIMRRYFDVLLADLSFAAENEAISISFINADRLQQKQGFGEVSELDVIEAQAEYQLSLGKRTQAELKQRSSRAYLAEAINKPGQLSERLEEPDLPDIDTEVPEYQALLERVMLNHGGIKALKAQLEALTRQEDIARLNAYPTVKAYGEVADYSRDESGADKWTLGIGIKVPLYQGGETAALKAEARARAAMVRAELVSTEAGIRQTVLELWQRLAYLNVELEQARTELDARDLYLDKSRARYQLQLQSDLGDAMIRFSRSRLRHATIVYDIAITRAQLDLLSGGMADIPVNLPE